ncbi:hypothetical protein PVAND_017388 [Polypedilum vanderplanki]|uniref:Uncharacterized protein n=1 Tax=Polypedilum vanderplanki TaxID=319348 RepID=A0A9J6BI46_POLVA|nr:hypothetical protein PVAND_017388 [Polypedilum vanderplanki]
MNFLILLIIFASFEASKSFEINCNYQIRTLNIIGDVYECFITNIPISQGNTVTNITGTHLSEKNNDDVEALLFSGDWILSFFPKGFSEFFPNIKAIFIAFSSIETLYGDELNEFPQLKYLDFWHSNLTTISSRLFENTPKIIFIEISSTNLKQVGHDLFTPLNITQLQWIDFTNNRCINKRVMNGSENTINSFINDLRKRCPFDDEENVITTTTERSLTCSDQRIEDFVCDLEEHLMTKDERIDNLESRVKWLEEQLQKMITNPLDCK